MFVAVMSDLHDNVANWQLIAKFLAEENIQTLINCGDTAAPAMLQEMSRAFAGQIHTVFGNVADRELETTVVAALANVTHYGEHGEVMMADKKIFFTHQPKHAEAAAALGPLFGGASPVAGRAGGAYDLICHGHTHLKRWEKRGRTYFLNPGTAGGMFQYPSFAVVELVNMTCSFQDVRL
ncbi:MAG: metallophosphoesterase family protein [Candidatus Kerfeldbacteria bacterium]|nr:metallophosphoesterase family protein [Candidatus Kerfeldbacteria bacterium]